MSAYVQTKICGRCDQVKQVTEFYRDNSLKSGRKGTCKECILRRNRNPFERIWPKKTITPSTHPSEEPQ